MSSPKRQFFAFLLLFLVINLLQSSFTGLLEDEAYYWVWSKNLAWGYFDHPPMVALFIWLGGLIFDGELGVRFVSAISFALTLWIMWKTIDSEGKERNIRLFFLLVVSLAMIQVYGFISTPDTPLILFTALFFYTYKRFLEDDRIQNSLILGFSMAALLYSKYHGVLIIGFVTLSNLKLFFNLRFWLAGIFGFALFVPHLLWQYENDFPSFVYHLKDRAYKPYEIGFTLNHLLNIIVVVGITFPIVYRAFWKKKASSMFEKSLKYNVFGFVLFFLLTSFRSQPQAQWLAAMLIPLGIFVYSYFLKNESARKWLYRLGLAQLGLVVIARIILAVPSLSPVVLEPHWADSWIPQVRKKTEGSPLIFVNSYQNASIYKFYTGIDTHSYGIPYGRKSQYSLLKTEDKIQGKSVFAVGKQLKGHARLTHKMGRDLYGMRIDSFNSFQRIKTTVDLEVLDMDPGNEIRVPFELINTYDRTLSFEQVHLLGMFQNRRKQVLEQFELSLPDLDSLKPFEHRRLEAIFIVPGPFEEDVVTFRIGVSFENMPAGLQGNKVLVNFTQHQE